MRGTAIGMTRCLPLQRRPNGAATRSNDLQQAAFEERQHHEAAVSGAGRDIGYHLRPPPDSWLLDRAPSWLNHGDA